MLASSDPAKSIAIIAHNGLQNSYGIGDLIDGTQAKIRQVFPDRVIIERDGRDETLMLDGEEYGKPLPKPGNQDGKLSSVRNELMGNPGKITDYLNISPVRVDGRMVGYRLNRAAIGTVQSTGAGRQRHGGQHQWAGSAG